MRKAEIVEAIMSSFTNVQDVEVAERPGMVTIVITTDLRNAAERYNLRTDVLQLLEKPAGIGIDLQMKSFDDGTLYIFREQVAAISTYTYNINERADVDDGEDWDDYGFEEPAQSTLSRFSAVAAEITETIKPLMKPAPTNEPVRQLMELLRVKLRLQSFEVYEQTQRNENIMREGKDLPPSGRDRERRTGRTTRGLVRAIAEYMCGDFKYLAVVGGSQIHSKELAMAAARMRETLNLARQMEIRPIMPADFDGRYDYTKTQRAHVYVDHYYYERNGRW